VRGQGEAIRRVDAEIAGEKAAALGRAGERLEAAMRELAAMESRVIAARAAGAEVELAEAYEQVRERVLRARLTLLIQREALGLRRHTVVDQQFPEPPSFPRLVAERAAVGGRGRASSGAPSSARYAESQRRGR
jgi:hypothetical protein